jgi:hypothetical protein
MRRFQDSDTALSHRPWAQTVCDHFDKHGSPSRPLEAKTLLAILHAVRHQARAYGLQQGAQVDRELYARIVASWSGYHIVAARWIVQSLMHNECAIVGAALLSTRRFFDRHGRLHARPSFADARAAVGTIEYYARAYDMPPSTALHGVFKAQGQPLDLAAAHNAFASLKHFVSRFKNETRTPMQAARATYDWAAAVESAFNPSGELVRRVDRHEAVAMLGAISRAANSGAVKCAFDPRGDARSAGHAARNRVLRRACILLCERTHLSSPVKAILVIAKLKAVAKSELLFPTLAKIA